MVKIAVLVSGGGTNLQALIDRQQAGELGCGQIGLVLSSRPGVYALERAQKAGIETVVVDRKSCATAEEFSARVLHQLQSRGVEMVVLAGFLSILCKDMVEAYPNRIINVHPSLIPSFCGKGFYGLKVHQAALDYGVKVTGATVHYVNEVTDGGSIILQKAVYIEPDDTPGNPAASRDGAGRMGAAAQSDRNGLPKNPGGKGQTVTAREGEVSMNCVELAQELRGNTYPGRGIVLGKSEDGSKMVIAYFIMGRSENSRNRVFVEQEDGIRTEAFDPSKLSDPSLIIYAPVRVLNGKTIVTNGDQTDTIYDFMKDGKTFEEALAHPYLRAGCAKLYPPHLRCRRGRKLQALHPQEQQRRSGQRAPLLL